MKLVEILAKEWKSWPHDCDHAVCDSDGEVRAIGTGTDHDFYPSDAVDVEDRLSGTALLVSHDGKTVTRADWEKEKMKQAAPKKNAEGWIRHRGGKCPVGKGVRVDVRYRNATPGSSGYSRSGMLAGSYHWRHDAGNGDIMTYRLHKPAEQTISDDDVIGLCVECADDEPEIVDGPLKWRDRITEIDAATQELTAERAELVQKLASEGFALIGRVVEPVEDMSNWRNWKVGDTVTVIENDEQETGHTKGTHLKIIRLEDLDYSGYFPVACAPEGPEGGWPHIKHIRWQSRPSA